VLSLRQAVRGITANPLTRQLSLPTFLTSIVNAPATPFCEAVYPLAYLWDERSSASSTGTPRSFVRLPTQPTNLYSPPADTGANDLQMLLSRR